MCQPETGVRLAVECDGEEIHYDEHGNLRIEDIERQEILERANWTVTRIPYSRWQKNPDGELSRIRKIINEIGQRRKNEQTYLNDNEHSETTVPEKNPILPIRQNRSPRVQIGGDQAALLLAIASGANSGDALSKKFKALLGISRMTKRQRERIHIASTYLTRNKLIATEGDEYFLTETGRETFAGRGRFGIYTTGINTEYDTKI